jgi:hypothetical protein
MTNTRSVYRGGTLQLAKGDNECFLTYGGHRTDRELFTY